MRIQRKKVERESVNRRSIVGGGVRKLRVKVERLDSERNIYNEKVEREMKRMI